MKTNQRNYERIRNYADHRCIKIEHNFKGALNHNSEFLDFLDQVEGFSTSKWTHSGKAFFFADDQDAMMCQLVMPE